MARGKVLIIDDEEDVREVLKFHLSGQNYQIIEAENGEDGIRLLESEDNMVNVGVILCDIRMPKVNGIDCIQYLRKEAPGIPIVVVTGFPDTEMATQLLKDGVKDYLVKPVDKEKLVSVVKKQVASKVGVGL
jgi:two-component system, chemotaxis family, chemotaxis protein CheY